MNGLKDLLDASNWGGEPQYKASKKEKVYLAVMVIVLLLSIIGNGLVDYQQMLAN